MTAQTDPFLIEENISFAKSKLWDFQRNFFVDQGIKAWKGQVPFYITCNPYIANCYAEVAINYILDHIRSAKHEPGEPYYVIELGAGSGKFSYYCLTRLFEMQEEYQLSDIKIVYVISDFTRSNLDFWRAQPQLAEYVKLGKLDFALVDVVADEQIKLVSSGKVLNQHTLKHPLIAFANYLFDSIPNDIFRVNNGELSEARTRLTIDEEKTKHNKNLSNISLDDVDVDISFQTITDNVYNDPNIDSILLDYKQSLKDTNFYFPSTPITAIQRLMTMTNNQLLLISSDKGYSYLQEMEGRSTPRIVTHGSFSIMVNYHALGEFFKKSGGDCWHQKIRESIKTSVFLIGDDFDKLPFTYRAIRNFIDDFGPGDFFNFHKHLGATKDSCSLKTIVSHMNFCHWDPRIFNLFIHKIIKEIRSANPVLVQALNEGVERLVHNVYEMPGIHEAYFNIGWFLHAVDRFEEALFYYRKVSKLHRQDFTIMYNMALCYSSMKKYKKALSYFKQAKSMKHDSKETDEWIAWLADKV